MRGHGLLWLTSLHHGPSAEEVRQELKVNTWGQELTQKLWRNAANWHASHSLLGLLLHSIQDQRLRVGIAYSELGYPHISHQSRNAPEARSQSKLVGHFLNRSLLFQNGSSMCQLDVTLSSTHPRSGGAHL